MSEDNLKIWDAVAKPPKEALKQIKGGRISGMTDIKPQWRYKAMTEQFGPCGIGWRYTITKEWTEQGSHEQVMCFVGVDLFYKHSEGWSEAIPGSGGSMLVTNESKGLHTSDEGFKMALTDALSVAMSRIGVAAEIYMGNWTGSKYKDAPVGAKKENLDKKEDIKWEAEPSSRSGVTEVDIMLVDIGNLKTKESAHKWKNNNQKSIDSLGADKGKVMTKYLSKAKELK